MSETWKPIPGFDGRYEASDLGRIRSHVRSEARPLVPWRQNMGYMMVSLGRGNKRLVHRLVLAAFLGEDSRECNHKNFDRTDNHLANLEYATASENGRHACAKPGRKPSPSVRRIRVGTGLSSRVFDSCAAFAESIGVARQSVSRALRRGVSIHGHRVEHA